jgi:hypothetical protein
MEVSFEPPWCPGGQCCSAGAKSIPSMIKFPLVLKGNELLHEIFLLLVWRKNPFELLINHLKSFNFVLGNYAQFHVRYMENMNYFFLASPAKVHRFTQLLLQNAQQKSTLRLLRPKYSLKVNRFI